MSGSTIPSEPAARWLVFERALRATVFAGVFGVVVWAMLGGAGLTTGERSETSDGLTLEVRYATVSRPGLATPFVITLARIDGRPLGDVEIELSRGYLDAFDENGLAPEPDRIDSDGVHEVWTYDDVESNMLSLDYDARIQPNMRWTRAATIVARVDSGSVRADVVTEVRP